MWIYIHQYLLFVTNTSITNNQNKVIYRRKKKLIGNGTFQLISCRVHLMAKLMKINNVFN
uniref:Uncharacterized protein n=1 Tax=Anguilla anguilla TaxID=7936 RepID=A0A0E9TXG1_ANGAN